MRVEGKGFRVQGSGVRVQGSGVRVQGGVFRILVFSVQRLGFQRSVVLSSNQSNGARYSACGLGVI